MRESKASATRLPARPTPTACPMAPSGRGLGAWRSRGRSGMTTAPPMSRARPLCGPCACPRTAACSSCALTACGTRSRLLMSQGSWSSPLTRGTRRSTQRGASSSARGGGVACSSTTPPRWSSSSTLPIRAPLRASFRSASSRRGCRRTAAPSSLARRRMVVRRSAWMGRSSATASLRATTWTARRGRATSTQTMARSTQRRRCLSCCERAATVTASTARAADRCSTPPLPISTPHVTATAMPNANKRCHSTTRPPCAVDTRPVLTGMVLARRERIHPWPGTRA